MNPYRLSAVFLAVLFGTGSMAANSAESARVSLLELYTSEGCNSCPPADRWVSSLRPQFGPDKLVVLAFHVDYWNYLGWPDRFSQRRFSERQQDMVRLQNLRTAYTPQLLLNGRDFRQSGGLANHLQRAADSPAAFKLQLESKLTNNTLNVRVHTTRLDGNNSEPAELYVAVYENNLTTDVRAGENRGEHLRHDFVVRTLFGPVPIHRATSQWSTIIPVDKDWKPADLGVAAFVQSARRGDVVQAVAQERLTK